MNVLHVHGKDYPDGGFGSVVSMYRLHSGLRAAGIDSRLLANKRMLPSSELIPRAPRLERFIGRVTHRLGFNDIHCVGAFWIKKMPAYQQADLLNFHGIHGDFLSYLALPTLTADKPSVFTVRDMWPLTGHCAVPFDCERWKIGCGKCPYPDAPPALPTRIDTTRAEWKLKDWVYRRSRLTVVTLSSRMTEQARQSMLARFPIRHIPNGVDTEAYQRLDPDLSRAALGVPPGKRVLVFAAGNLNRPYKGAIALIATLKLLPPALQREVVLLLVGDGGELLANAFPVQTLPLGYIGGIRLKSMAYSAADLCVLPTHGEGMPNVLLESMACSTPMVSFDVGGIPDLVRPGVTGYLARANDVGDLRDGIVHLLEDAPLRRAMGQRCREIAVAEYSAEREVRAYIDLYNEVLGRAG
jgi:glycosyltransferase involved in cell wall biosynthesis